MSVPGLLRLPTELFDLVVAELLPPGAPWHTRPLLPLRAACRALDDRLSSRIFSVRIGARRG